MQRRLWSSVLYWASIVGAMLALLAQLQSIGPLDGWLGLFAGKINNMQALLALKAQAAIGLSIWHGLLSHVLFWLAIWLAVVGIRLRWTRVTRNDGGEPIAALTRAAVARAKNRDRKSVV